MTEVPRSGQVRSRRPEAAECRGVFCVVEVVGVNMSCTVLSPLTTHTVLVNTLTQYV